MSVPLWKQVLIDRKKQKKDDSEEQQRQVKEDDQLANLPAWKRAIVLKQREKEKKEATSHDQATKPEQQVAPSKSEIQTAAAVVQKPDARAEAFSESFPGATPSLSSEKPSLPKSESADRLAKTNSTVWRTSVPKSQSYDVISKPDPSRKPAAGISPRTEPIPENQSVTPGMPKSQLSGKSSSLERQTIAAPKSDTIGNLAAAFLKPELSQKPFLSSTFPRSELPGKGPKTVPTAREQPPAVATPEVPKDTCSAKQAQVFVPPNAGRAVPPSSAVENKSSLLRAQQPAKQPPVTEARLEQPQALLRNNALPLLPSTKETPPPAQDQAGAAARAANRNSAEMSPPAGLMTPPNPKPVKAKCEQKSADQEGTKTTPIPLWKKALLERKKSSPSALGAVAEKPTAKEPEHTTVVLKPVQRQDSTMPTATPSETPSFGVLPNVAPFGIPTVTPDIKPKVVPNLTPSVAQADDIINPPDTFNQVLVTPKGGLADDSNIVPAEIMKVAPVETPKVAPVETPKVSPVETPKVIPVETPKVTPMEILKVTPMETPKVTPVETPKGTPKVTPMETPKVTPKVTPVETPKVAPVEIPKVTPVKTPKVAPVESTVSAPLSPPRVAPLTTPSVAPLTLVSGAKTTPSLVEQRKLSFAVPVKPPPITQPQRKTSAPPLTITPKPSVPQRTPSPLSPPPNTTALAFPLSPPPNTTALAFPSSPTPLSPPPSTTEVINSDTKEPMRLIELEGTELRPPVFQEVREWANVSEDDPQFQGIPEWKKALILRRREDIAKRSGQTTPTKPSVPQPESLTSSNQSVAANKKLTNMSAPSQVSNKQLWGLAPAPTSTSSDKDSLLSPISSDKDSLLSPIDSKTNALVTKPAATGKSKPPWSAGNRASSLNLNQPGGVEQTPQGVLDKSTGSISSQPAWANSNLGQLVGVSSSSAESVPTASPDEEKKPTSVKILLGKFGARAQQKNATLGGGAANSQTAPPVGKAKPLTGNVAPPPTSQAKTSTPEPMKPGPPKPNLFSPPPNQLSPMRPSSNNHEVEEEGEESDLEVTNIDDVLEDVDGDSCPVPTAMREVRSDAFLPQQSTPLPSPAPAEIAPLIRINGLDQSTVVVAPPSTVQPSIVSALSSANKVARPPLSSTLPMSSSSPQTTPPTSPVQKTPPPSPVSPISPSSSTVNVKPILIPEGVPKKKSLRRVSWSDSSLVVQHVYPKYAYEDYDETQEGSNEEGEQEENSEVDGGGPGLELPVHPLLQTAKSNRDPYSAQPKSTGVNSTAASPQGKSIHNYKPSIIASYGSLLEDRLNEDTGRLSGIEEDTRRTAPTPEAVKESDSDVNELRGQDIAALIW